MKSEKSLNSISAIPSPAELKGQVIHTFILWSVSVLTSIILILPEELHLLQQEGAWASRIFGLVIILLLLIGPAVLFVLACLQYRDARTLEQRGVTTKGIILEAWTELTHNQQLYYVRYKFLKKLHALQCIDISTFKKLKRLKHVDVLYLKESPQIARLDLKA